MKLKKQNRKRIQFFSLMEVIIAITIVALVAAIAIKQLSGKTEGALIKISQTALTSLSGDILRFKLDTGKLPENIDELVENTRNLQGWVQYMTEVPTDGWKNPIEYVKDSNSSKGYTLTSLGADGQSGGEGINADLIYPKAKKQ